MRLKTKIGFLTTLITLSLLSMGANKIGDVEIRDLTVTGTSSGVTAASAATDWVTATSYGVDQIVVDPNSGILYRSNQAHTSTGTNLTDDAAKYDIIGSSSSGAIALGWQTLAGATSTHVTNTTTTALYKRMGDTGIFSFLNVYSGVPNSTTLNFHLPSGLTVDTSKLASGTSYTNTVGTFMGSDDGSTGPWYGGVVQYENGTSNFLARVEGTQTPVRQDAPYTIGSGDYYNFIVTVPILEWNNTDSVSIADLTEKTVSVDNSVLDIVTATAGEGTAAQRPASVQFASALAYKDTNGLVWLTFDLRVTTGGDPTAFIKLTGVTFSTDGNHAFSAQANGSNFEQAYADGSNNRLTYTGTGTPSSIHMSGTVRLQAEPTWFSANRENPASVSAFIPDLPGIANIRGSEGGGTTVLTSSDRKNQVFNLSSAHTVRMPTTGITQGQIFEISNVSQSRLSFQSSDTSSITGSTSTYDPRIYQGRVTLRANINAPTTPSNWTVVEVSDTLYKNTEAVFGTVQAEFTRHNRDVYMFIDNITTTNSTSVSGGVGWIPLGFRPVGEAKNVVADPACRFGFTIFSDDSLFVNSSCATTAWPPMSGHWYKTDEE